MLKPGDLVMLVSPQGKRYVRKLRQGETMQTHYGLMGHETILRADYGALVHTHLGHPFRLIKPSLYDLVKKLKRRTQIIYPKEIGYILLKLGVAPGGRVIEAGSGSGALTTALAWFVGDQGRVYTYEQREEFFKLCGENLGWAGLGERVEQFNRNIAEGFLQTDVDAVFLDVRTPWDYLDHAVTALLPGAPMGFLLPTTNQVSTLLSALEKGPFEDVEVLEILLRRYKPVAERLRPDDRMVAHTGFLIFARHEGREHVDESIDPSLSADVLEVES
ncbi:MAG TPA: tRNA (adenine-N1)-methyltransferase [Desulfonatronum sp.]|nr:tRNA (adenine-N1)-methyltransferase [Desulfonatronum sp.]